MKTTVNLFVTRHEFNKHDLVDIDGKPVPKATTEDMDAIGYWSSKGLDGEVIVRLSYFKED